MPYFVGAHCDKCGKDIAWFDLCTKYIMNYRLRRAGWTVGKQILCPNCRRKKKS